MVEWRVACRLWRTIRSNRSRWLLPRSKRATNRCPPPCARAHGVLLVDADSKRFRARGFADADTKVSQTREGDGA